MQPAVSLEPTPGRDDGSPSVPAQPRPAPLRDASIFGRAYRELSGPVSDLIHRILRDPAQSEEVVQEVFLEVWRLAARFDPQRGSLRSWVLTIAHRRAVDRVRAERAAADRDARAGVLAERDSSVDTVVELVIRLMECERVRFCLKKLTGLQHEAVRLVYYSGLTQRETADLLGVPLTTVKARLRDALLRLRACVDDRDDAPRRRMPV
ncbi:sigma-70 family RNA polymerase sigma factor [Thermobifida halotolerans]|uniref:Sigma-70 family RNA polymerase sigma factor n=1 Tax=Thermobifida halotolerans TaxID=483545 RepID=A0AA97M0S5_9ACTN|nr:sigma-70 family RNA polymerase sigma factor [Thermobifida halotolerans]UOE21710.1 sigma-70 family RNA polymerase sigma factor [Thermobifida halotolerans]